MSATSRRLLRKRERGFSASAGSTRGRRAAPSPGRRDAGARGGTGPRPIMADRVRVGVLVSGRGTNMVALSEYKRREARSYDLALVASNVPEARGLVVAP